MVPRRTLGAHIATEVMLNWLINSVMINLKDETTLVSGW